MPTTSLRTHCEVYAKDMSVLHYDNNVRDVSLCTLRHQCHSPVCEHTSDLMPHRAICVHLTCSHYDVNSKELFVNTYKISVTGLLRTHYEAIHLLLLTCLCSHCAMRLMLMTCLCSHYRVNPQSCPCSHHRVDPHSSLCSHYGINAIVLAVFTL